MLYIMLFVNLLAVLVSLVQTVDGWMELGVSQPSK